MTIFLKKMETPYLWYSRVCWCLRPATTVTSSARNITVLSQSGFSIIGEAASLFWNRSNNSSMIWAPKWCVSIVWWTAVNAATRASTVSKVRLFKISIPSMLKLNGEKSYRTEKCAGLKMLIYLVKRNYILHYGTKTVFFLFFLFLKQNTHLVTNLSNQKTGISFELT